ncbi:hydroxymethylglutaryl-CoA lyase [Niveispirillum lacus]|uniref:Hydroxymethylglutaryl-CoA lyase n=1 Tax=Niveispirillum lacus TaxID=1981099 RepID=A0A255YR21_9PROT|nr:hydroxymethylglutaryl-CoA lyase [Niveispirillum lacus]OYQ31659.1 hydroxymethylglutaryl-CoA lyase [Niveispirillum lacus]
MPSQVEIVEVSPRDGLQNEATPVSTEQKVELINRAIAAGAKRIEVTSFVNPKRVPQMADAEAVLAALPRDNGVSYIGLAMNGRGFDRALAAGVTEVNYVLVASDTFSQRNNGAPTMETLTGWAEVAAAARAAKIPTSVTIGASFGCPFEGEVAVARVVEVAKRAADHGVDEIALADTIGVASPADVVERFQAVAEALPGIRLRAHFHNTRNTGIANAYAATTVGVAVLDSSLGGIGGCPFAPAATGNIPTEDLVYMLNRMKIASGIDLAAAIEAARWLEGIIGRRNPAMLGRAGMFPAPAQAAE